MRDEGKTGLEASMLEVVKRLGGLMLVNGQ